MSVAPPTPGIFFSGQIFCQHNLIEVAVVVSFLSLVVFGRCRLLDARLRNLVLQRRPPRTHGRFLRPVVFLVVTAPDEATIRQDWRKSRPSPKQRCPCHHPQRQWQHPPLNNSIQRTFQPDSWPNR